MYTVLHIDGIDKPLIVLTLKFNKKFDPWTTKYAGIVISGQSSFEGLWGLMLVIFHVFLNIVSRPHLPTVRGVTHRLHHPTCIFLRVKDCATISTSSRALAYFSAYTPCVCLTIILLFRTLEIHMWSGAIAATATWASILWPCKYMPAARPQHRENKFAKYSRKWVSPNTKAHKYAFT